jgi:hypothetical protein
MLGVGIAPRCHARGFASGDACFGRRHQKPRGHHREPALQLVERGFWKLLFAAARESAHGTFETSPMHRAKSVFRLRRASYANFTDTMSIGEFHEGRRMSAALFLLSACAHALGALLSLSSPASVTAISSSICRIGKLRSKPVRDFRSTAIL